jgi:outer membrane protein OmpA-like peptidoglycan-associated protein
MYRRNQIKKNIIFAQKLKKRIDHIMKIKSVLILFCLTVSCLLLSAQQTPSKKSISLLGKAKVAFKSGEFDKASQYLHKIFSEDKFYAEAHIMQAEIYTVTLQPEKAAFHYNNAIRLLPKPTSILYFNAASEELKSAQYEQAFEHFNLFLSRGEIWDQEMLQELERGLEVCRFAMEAIKNPVAFNPINMGSNINSERDEYLAALTADEMELIFTVRLPRSKKTVCAFCQTEEDFYASHKKDGLWQPRYPLESPINTGYNEGAQAISPDGRYLFYTLCNADFGYGSCDLYWAKRIGNRWSRPRNMGTTVNTKNWESQPTIGTDGKTVYFASNRPGGYGGVDIWKTEMLEEGVFSEPVNLGPVINTKKDDTAPFIHPDGRTLYFASDGRPGMGGKDLYYAVLLDNNIWTEPVNLGYPINTQADEINILISASGTTAYFASDKSDGYGGLDLYYFILDEQLRPTPVTYIKGKVQDALTLRPLEATIEMIDLNQDKVVTSTSSDPVTGDFLACILTGTNVLLNVHHPDYPFYSENFQLEESYSDLEPFLKNIRLEKAEIGTTFILRNIFFDFGNDELKKESYPELDRLTTYLENNKNIHIEIGGHTDNIGSDEYNNKLSLGRAKSVYDYLIKKGIEGSRLSFKGYGKNAPIADNDTEEGRAINRRTEFKIIFN